MSDFRLLMISAMYENGGNVTHRFLDGHPEMLVYPFESQVGTSLVHDPLTTMFPVKYRWPVFDLAATRNAACASAHRTSASSVMRRWICLMRTVRSSTCRASAGPAGRQAAM